MNISKAICLFLITLSAHASFDGTWIGKVDVNTSIYRCENARAVLKIKSTMNNFEITELDIDCPTEGVDLEIDKLKINRRQLIQEGVVVGSISHDVINFFLTSNMGSYIEFFAEKSGNKNLWLESLITENGRQFVQFSGFYSKE